jgi:hypothetical protein
LKAFQGYPYLDPRKPLPATKGKGFGRSACQGRGFTNPGGIPTHARVLQSYLALSNLDLTAGSLLIYFNPIGELRQARDGLDTLQKTVLFSIYYFDDRLQVLSIPSTSDSPSSVNLTLFY